MPDRDERPDECVWKAQIHADTYRYITSCKWAMVLPYGTYKKSKYIYCPKCGGKIKEKNGD